MTEDDDSKARLNRSPNFPYINLTVALDRAQQLYASSRGNPVRLRDAADDWKLSPTSSGTQRVAAALLAFGLLTDEGSGDERRLKLSQTAMRILDDTRPGIREGLLRDAALRPAVIREYYNKWHHRRPSDSHAISQLKFDSGFNDDSARMFLRVFDDALGYVDGTDDLVSERDEEEVSVVASELEQVRSVRSMGPAERSAAPAEAAIRGEEWFKAKVGRETTVTILAEGTFGRVELERLLRLLEAQKEVMDDEF